MDQLKKKKIKTIVLFVVMAVVAFFSIFELYAYIRKSVHIERTNYLTSQTKSVVNMIDQNLDRYSEYANVCRQTVAYELKDGTDIDEFMDDIQAKLLIDDARLILVDSNCIWYAEEGNTGRITSLESYYDNTPDELVYITTGVDVDVASFVFRVRLDQPVSVTKNGHLQTIQYCAVILYMDDFTSKIRESFPYDCNSFIVDETGLMLYKNFRMGILIEGTNVYSKYERIDTLFGDAGAEQIQKIENGETSVVEAVMNDHNYFICSDKLSYNNWGVTFVIDTNDLVAGSYITKLAIFMTVIAVTLGITIALIGYAVLKINAGQNLLDKEKQANEYLEKASVAKTEFLSNMSHDIRTPINGIMGMTALAKKEPNNEKTQECLNKIDISSKYLLSLVNDVLDMSAIESGALKISTKPMNIKNFGKSCIDIINGQLQNRNLKIVVDFESVSHGDVLGDEMHLRQIFINILGNAVKFTPDGGEIQFTICETSATEKDAHFLFTIKDTGAGMEKSILDTLWTRFTQGDAGARSNYKGTGLGMAITKKLVDAMDGTIQVESSVGHGSTFQVDLHFDLCAPLQEESFNQDPASIQGLRVLLAEDNEINMEIAKELLQQCGLEVTPAEDGQIATDIFGEKPEFYFDVILMDVMMPKMNGLEACRAIRKMKRADAKVIPIIAMTANTSNEDMEKTKTAGMNAHLNKPMDLQEVVETISRLKMGGVNGAKGQGQ